MDLVEKGLSVLGLRLVRTPGWLARRRLRAERRSQARLAAAIAGAPLDPLAHDALSRALEQQGRWFAAHATARSALALRPDAPQLARRVDATRAALPALLAIGHNRYHRLRDLSRRLVQLGAERGSLLDVGGGDGELAAFLPECRYLLADRGSNGLDALALPAGLGRFDYVVSCHVLEHVPVPDRDAFLDALLARSERGVLLLNPFQLEDDFERERLRLVVELTGARWAREHLECSLPRLQDVRAFAASRGLTCEAEPVGAATTAAAYVFLDHFARLAGATSELRRIDRLFNERLCAAEHAPDAPTGYAVLLGRR